VLRLARVGILVLLAMAGLSAAGPAPSIVEAVKSGDRDAVRALLRAKADVNKPESDGTTALHYAVRADALDLVTMLGQGRRQRQSRQPLRHPADHAGRDQRRRQGAGRLDRSRRDPNTRTAAGEPVLMTAARTGSAEAVQALLSRGADVKAREQWFGETALMWAASQNHTAVVKALVAAGAEVNARSTVLEAPVLEFPRSGGPNSPFPRGGWTALMFAARDGAIEAADRARRREGRPQQRWRCPRPTSRSRATSSRAPTAASAPSALVFAIINSHFDLAAALLDRGADPNVADLSGMAALYAAVDMNSVQWTQGRPAPIFTDRLDAVDLAKQLLQKGANPNARLKRSPLKRHHDAGTTLNFGEGATPLMRAARTNDVAAMKVLLDGGADPFLTLPDRTTTLMIASGLGYGGLRGEAIRIVGPDGRRRGAKPATLLLERGVDVNAFNAAGQTALHGAVGRGEPVVELLVARGATLFKNKAGFTPLDVALGQAAAAAAGAVSSGRALRPSCASSRRTAGRKRRRRRRSPASPIDGRQRVTHPAVSGRGRGGVALRPARLGAAVTGRRTLRVSRRRSRRLRSASATALLDPAPDRSAPQGEERPMIAHVAVADLDRDGLADVLVCDAVPQRGDLVRQAPRGTFTEQTIAPVAAPAHVQVVDVDGDGDLDLLVAALGFLHPNNARIGAVLVLENDGRQRFTTRTLVDRVARVADARAADLDGDGDLDVGVAGFGYDDGETSWLENAGGWRFVPHVLQRLSGGINTVPADFDGDGRPDLVSLISQEWDEIWAFVNAGGGRFTPRLVWGSTNPDFGSSWLSVADLDRDGDPDLLYANGDAFEYAPPNSRPWQGVQWLENRGQFRFELHRLVSLQGAPAPKRPISTATATWTCCSSPRTTIGTTRRPPACCGWRTTA
jgi:ankyrin repeat protein